MSSQIDPIIVVGMNRSGTKWLSNMLCNHEAISGILSEDHFGILETNMLSSLAQRFPSLTEEDTYLALISCWAPSDFFQITGLTPEFCYQLSPRPETCPQLLAATMKEVARRAGSKYWLQKVSPHFAGNIFELYPRARVIIIQRDLVPTIKSHMTLMEEPIHRKSLLRNVMSYVVQENVSKRLRQDARVTFVRFEDMKENPTATLKQLCDFLGLSFREDLVLTPFQKNTSFKGFNQRKQVFSRGNEKMLRFMATLVRALPHSLLARIYARYKQGKIVMMMPGTYRRITQPNQKPRGES